MKTTTIAALHEVRLTVVQIAIPLIIGGAIIWFSEPVQKWREKRKEEKAKKKAKKEADYIDATWSSKN